MESVQLSGTVGIRGAGDHPHAAHRLRTGLPTLEWFDLSGDAPDGVPVVSLTGTRDLVEGAYAIDVSGGAVPSIQIAGGPFSGVIYGVEELVHKQAVENGATVTIPAGTVSGKPGLPYRTFWNWDHSTNWEMETVGVQEIGAVNPYSRPDHSFLADFKRCIDFMSRNRIAAVTVYGFLRDAHGGVDTAKELCRYANERGVRILPGVAIHAYGGIAFDMDHQYNLATWLRKHPHLTAEMERPAGFQVPNLEHTLHFPKGEYLLRGCPSRPENQEWMAEGIAWLAETFEIGGINIEAGDYGVCGCSLCASRRAAREDASRREGYAESWSHADMADLFPRLYGITKERRPDAWVYSEIQWDNLLDREALEPLRGLPEGGIYQHTFNNGYWERIRDEMTPEYGASVPTAINVFRCQGKCQWNGDKRTERYFFNGRDFAEMAAKTHEVGFDGLTIWGEASAYHTNAELSYLAFARFSWEPTLTWQRFVREDVAPLLGGEAAAARYLAIANEFDQNFQQDPVRLKRMLGEALEGARQPDDTVARRWLWLAEHISRRGYNQSTAPGR